MVKYVDNTAKAAVKLFRQTDTHGKFFYIGKLQFPGNLNLEKGVSFIVLISERDKVCPVCNDSFSVAEEKMLIGPMKEDDRIRVSREVRATPGRLKIDLRPFTDVDGNIGYVGEAMAPTNIDMSDGIFFTIFLSREGFEELQITRLDHNRRKYKFDDDPVDDDYYSDEDVDCDNDDGDRLKGIRSYHDTHHVSGSNNSR